MSLRPLTNSLSDLVEALDYAADYWHGAHNDADGATEQLDYAGKVAMSKIDRGVANEILLRVPPWRPGEVILAAGCHLRKDIDEVIHNHWFSVMLTRRCSASCPCDATAHSIESAIDRMLKVVGYLENADHLLRLALPPGLEGADNIPDRGKNSVPSSADVRDLCLKLLGELPQGRNQVDIARDFTGGNEKKAESLLRQARRYRHIWRPKNGNGQ